MKKAEIIRDYLEKNINCHVQGKSEELNAVIEGVKAAFVPSEDKVLIEVSCNQGQTKEDTMHTRYFMVWKAVLEQLKEAVDVDIDSDIVEIFDENEFDNDDIDYMELMYALFECVQDKNIYVMLKDFDYFREIFPKEEVNEEIGYPFGSLFFLSKTKSLEAPGNLSIMILSTHDYSEIVHNLQRYVDSYWQHAYSIAQVEE